MKTAYIDSSFLLSILFEDSNYVTSVHAWNSIDTFLSSVLLEIECRVNLHKYYLLSGKDKELYRRKEAILDHLLSCINLKMIDGEILMEIRGNDKVKQERSLDSIHLATANIFKKLTKAGLTVCSYDRRMIKAAKSLGMSVL